MFDLVSNDNTMRLLEATMDLASARHSVITSNIANVDTPGYKAMDMEFAKELRVALRMSQGGDVAPGSSGKFSYDVMLRPRLFEVSDVTPRQDGNTVDMDMEMGKMAKTVGAYSRAAAIYAIKLRMLKTVVSGGE